MHHMKCLYLCQPGVMDRWMDRERGGSMGTWVGEDEEEGERVGEREVNWLPRSKDRWMQPCLLHKCKQLVGSLTGQNHEQP